MAICYGVADVAEDLKLASILNIRSGHLLRMDRAEVAAANALTRIKIVMLILSLIGGLIFAGLLLVQRLIKFVHGLGIGASPGEGQTDTVGGGAVPA
jgi:hypothetical protein